MEDKQTKEKSLNNPNIEILHIDNNNDNNQIIKEDLDIIKNNSNKDKNFITDKYDSNLVSVIKTFNCFLNKVKF